MNNRINKKEQVAGAYCLRVIQWHTLVVTDRDKLVKIEKDMWDNGTACHNPLTELEPI